MHPDAARDATKVNQFLSLLRASWEAGIGGANGDGGHGLSAADQLTAVCAALEAAASQATYLPYLRSCTTGRLSFVRSASTDAAGDDSGATNAYFPATGGSASAGGSGELVRLMLTESRAATLATVMTAFSRTGTLPEWYNLLLCAPSIANTEGGGGGRESVDAAKSAMAACWEPVANLIRRWSGTNINKVDGLSDGASAGGVASGGAGISADSGTGGIFVLAFVDELPINVQQRTLDLIRQHAPFAKVPLLLIGRDPSASGEGVAVQSPLISQLTAHRVHEEPLSDKELETLWAEISGRHAQGMVLLTSTRPGTGKSFEARRRAANQSATYVHVRINRGLMADELALLLSQRLAATADLAIVSNAKSQRVLFHLDIAESVGRSLDQLLFQLLTQGCLVSQVGSINCYLTRHMLNQNKFC